MLKNWARLLFIGQMLFTLVGWLRALYRGFFVIESGKGHMSLPHCLPHVLFSFVLIMFIFLLTRPKVKEQFK